MDAVHFKFVVLLLDLLLLGLLLVLIVDVVDVGVTNQVVTLPLFELGRDLPLLVVIVDEHLAHVDVELSLLELIGSWKVWVELELLCHLVDQHVLAVVVLGELDLGGRDLRAGRERHRAVDELVRTILILLNDLVLLVEELFSQDETILLPVMVEVELAVASIDSYHLLPVVVLEATFIVLNEFEFVGETPTDHELILTARIV